MADNEQNPQTPSQSQQDPASMPAATNNDQQPGPVPYERFREVNSQLRELQQWKQQQEAAQAEQQRQQLAEQGKWKELAEQREKELNAERLRATRMKIAAAKGIPLDLADRLVGEDEEALKKDADRILAYLKPASGPPGVPPPSNGGQSGNLDITKMSPEEIRKNRGKLLPGRRS
jgi:hypothetical protein